MTRREKADFIVATLDRLYPDPQVPLCHQDEFTLLVAVVLSAQATDACVNRVTPALFARAASAQAMSELSVKEIEEIIRPCGLAPRKARALHGLSRLIVQGHGGRVPRTRRELEQLPGVGRKTASVMLVQAFDVPAFPVDTHIHRLMHRWGLSSGTNVQQTERDCMRLFPREDWRKLHLQLILFGREYCPARGHEANRCPVCSHIGES